MEFSNPNLRHLSSSKGIENATKYSLFNLVLEHRTRLKLGYYFDPKASPINSHDHGKITVMALSISFNVFMRDKDNLTPYLPGLEKEHEWTCKDETELFVNLFNQEIFFIIE